MTATGDVLAGRGGPQAITQRRAVLNAVIAGRDPHELDLPAAVVSWHLIWLHHARLIDVQDDRIRYLRHAA